MNYIWVVVLLLSALILGIKDITTFNSIVMSVGEDVLYIAIPLIASSCFFNGWLFLAMKCGIIGQLIRLVNPIFKWIFPDLKGQDKALGFITSNIVMNMIGLGSAATSSGLMAMKELDEINGHKETASRSMRTFIIMNTAGITLFSTTVASLRSDYGSITPFNHIPYAFASSTIALIIVLLIDRIWNKND